MPIYEFRCEDCGHIFEILSVSGGDEGTPRCPQCGGEVLERVLSRVAYTIGGGSKGAQGGPHVQSRSCSDGSCSTITLPGLTE
jgi:putative FmdB family regulatory protein